MHTHLTFSDLEGILVAEEGRLPMSFLAPPEGTETAGA